MSYLFNQKVLNMVETSTRPGTLLANCRCQDGTLARESDCGCLLYNCGCQKSIGEAMPHKSLAALPLP